MKEAAAASAVSIFSIATIIKKATRNGEAMEERRKTQLQQNNCLMISHTRVLRGRCSTGCWCVTISE